MKTIRFGIIGCGLMGREFGSAVARWGHLLDVDTRPVITHLACTIPSNFDWFRRALTTIEASTGDYREILSNPNVDAIYCAVPHHLHEEIYTAVIRSGKHLLGEKPFGIDLAANEAILAAMAERPEVFVRCSSQFPFFPAMQEIGRMIDSHAFGQIIGVNVGFLHSSDMDRNKPINWKRQVATNGEYGVLGDLGMHACHIPFRAGWFPESVHAVLSNLVPERPDGKGNMTPCETWDNATLLCEARNPADGGSFPLTMKTQRIAPGETNTWFCEVYGMEASARFNTKNPRRLELMEYRGGRQAWQEIDLGYQSAFPTITGGIFEFGFTDAILQMWAAFIDELASGRRRGKFTGCATPEEAHLSHRLFTAALESHRHKSCVTLQQEPSLA